MVMEAARRLLVYLARFDLLKKKQQQQQQQTNQSKNKKLC